MPQESLTTFSPGLKAEIQASTALSVDDSPVLKFSEKSIIGAEQTSPVEGTFSGLAESSTKAGSSGSTSDPQIPIGLTLKPKIKLTGSGDGTRLMTRQLWEGTVVKVLKNGFVATISDKTNSQNPDEQASFEFDNMEISPADRPLICNGASFYWTIGSQVTRAKNVVSVSFLEFRRTPAWTQRRLDRAAERARRLRLSIQENA